MRPHVLLLTMILVAAAAAAGAAQRTTGGRAAEPAAAAAPVDEQNARETRERLQQILQQYPPSLGQVLRLDPSLLTKPEYLAPYPTLAAYLGQHPEVAHNPTFFLGPAAGGPQSADARVGAMSAIESIFIGLEVMLGFMAAVAALSWAIRGAIDYRRWLRTTKVQVDAHTKIVDRLASNEDLLAYMQSPAGQRFLTASTSAAPIDAVAAPMSAPLNRILWSVQAGVVIAAGGVGLWLAKNNVIDEIAQALQVVSMLAIALGIGFVLSALASWALSRQFGLVRSPTDHA
jgi:hypothetical protein